MTIILLSTVSSCFRSRSSSGTHSSSSNSFLPSFNRAFNNQTRSGGYHRVGENGGQQPGGNVARGIDSGTIGSGRGQGRTLEEDENRLIDQLDEEWDD